MQPFLDAKACDCKICTNGYDYGNSQWREYYDKSKPTPVMKLLKDSGKEEYIINNCKRTLSILKDFDAGKFRKPSDKSIITYKDEEQSYVKGGASQSNVKGGNFERKTIPEHMFFIANNKHDNEACDALFWLLVKNIDEFARFFKSHAGCQPGANSADWCYDPEEPQYDDDGNLYLGGVYHDGILVGGSKMNVLIMVSISFLIYLYLYMILIFMYVLHNILYVNQHICNEFEEMGYEPFSLKEGKLVKRELVKDINLTVNKDSGSFRAYIYKKLGNLLSVDGGKRATLQLQAKKSQEDKMQKERKRIGKLTPLGTMDPHYVPFFERTREDRDEQDGNVTEDEIRRFEAQFDLLKKSQLLVEATKPRAVSRICA